MKNMMTKLKMMLTNNFAIKIVAIVAAFIIWLAVVNVSDPEKTVIISNVPITVTDEEAVTDLGMVYSLDSDDTIDVTVSGKRSVVSKLTADDFTVTASLSELSKVNAVPVEVSVKKSSSGKGISIVKQSVQTVSISIEEIEKEEYDIEVDFSGSTADGYVVGTYSLSKSTVNIKAPTSVLEKISRVVAECTLNGESSDISEKCKLKLYDKKGKEIKDDSIDMSVSKVTVSVSILQEKEVPVNVSVSGTPADGYKTGEITLSQDTVKLIGAQEVLDAIDQIEVTDGVNVSGKKSDVKSEIDLASYLPEGVTVDGDSVISVTVSIEELETKTFTISTDDIKVSNLKEGLSLKISSKSVKITLRGEKEVIDKISEDDITASVDLTGVGKGTSKVPVEFDIPEGVELISSVQIKVKLK